MFIDFVSAQFLLIRRLNQGNNTRQNDKLKRKVRNRNQTFFFFATATKHFHKILNTKRNTMQDTHVHRVRLGRRIDVWMDRWLFELDGLECYRELLGCLVDFGNRPKKKEKRLEKKSLQKRQSLISYEKVQKTFTILRFRLRKRRGRTRWLEGCMW